MATVSIDYKVLFTNVLDKTLVPALTSGWMAENARGMTYLGAGEFKFPKKTTSGLGAYSDSTGYNAGDFTLNWETRKVEQLRSVTFNLPKIDMDETGIELVSDIMVDFQMEHVAPELDSYRYSKLFSIANTALRTINYTAASATILATLKNQVSLVRNEIGADKRLVVSMAEPVVNILEQSGQITRNMDVGANSGQVSTLVNGIDGIEIRRVPSSRMKSEYTFSATNGFAPVANALDINWIISSRDAVVAPVAVDEMRVFDPMTNQTVRAWKLDYMVMHDLWMLDNKQKALYVCYASVAAPALTATVAQGSASGATKFTATAGSGNTLGYTLTDAADPGYLNTIPTVTAYTSGADITATAGKYLNMFELNTAGRIVKFATHLLVSGDIKA